jgi:quercetin dioxygenase-like cupin family protein
MHYFGRFEETALQEHPVYAGHSQGYRLAELVGRATGSVHTGLTLNELAPGGDLDPHVHAFEEGFYILSGEAIVNIAGTSWHLVAGDYGAIKVDTPHAWRAAGAGPVRWLQMAAPQPKPPGAERDTFFYTRAKGAPYVAPTSAPRLDPSTPNGQLLGHFDERQIPPPGQRQTAAAGLEGVFLKWLLDENIGTRHHRLLFIEYQPGVSIGLHDHTFEESYFILSGEVEGTMDGRTYRARAGDVLWTGVGCVHAFGNVGREPVRWLETFAPQPPKENVFRFMAEWERKASEIER